MHIYTTLSRLSITNIHLLYQIQVRSECYRKKKKTLIECSLHQKSCQKNHTTYFYQSIEKECLFRQVDFNLWPLPMTRLEDPKIKSKTLSTRYLFEIP